MIPNDIHQLKYYFYCAYATGSTSDFRDSKVLEDVMKGWLNGLILRSHSPLRVAVLPLYLKTVDIPPH